MKQKRRARTAPKSTRPRRRSPNPKRPRNAKYDLEGASIAPANGRVTNLALHPGVRATQFATMPGDEFHPGGRPVGARLFPPERTALRRTGQRGGNLPQDLPGPHHQVQGGLHPVGHGAGPDADQRQPANHHARAPRSISASRFACSSSSRRTRTSSSPPVRGAQAPSTPSMARFIHIIRKVFVRVSTKIDWFVFKLH